MFGSNYNDHRMKLGYTPKSDSDVDREFYARAVWKMKFAWWPHRCEITRKIIWLQYAYRGYVRWSDYGWATPDYRWHCYDEHIIWELQR